MSEIFKEIEQTLKEADNEGTSAPYWLIIEPLAVTGHLTGKDEETGKTWKSNLEKDDIERIEDAIPAAITGPFFSREDANDHLSSRRYAFSKKAFVYCFSGYWSFKYKTALRKMGKT